eukprot:5591274-Prymnesium_polylepis.1
MGMTYRCMDVPVRSIGLCRRSQTILKLVDLLYRCATRTGPGPTQASGDRTLDPKRCNNLFRDFKDSSTNRANI